TGGAVAAPPVPAGRGVVTGVVAGVRTGVVGGVRAGVVATGRSSNGEAGGRGLTGLGRGLDGVVTRDRILGDGEVGGERAVLVRRDGHRFTDGVALRIHQLHLHLGARREVLTGHRGGVARVDGARI